jgi:hypothetical protein
MQGFAALSPLSQLFYSLISFTAFATVVAMVISCAAQHLRLPTAERMLRPIELYKNESELSLAYERHRGHRNIVQLCKFFLGVWVVLTFVLAL